MKKRHRVRNTIIAVLLVLVLVVGSYATYVFTAYSRVEDYKSLSVENNQASTVEVGKEYSVLSYNIGFGAYEPDYSFFMDGGKHSKAFSKERLIQNMDNIAKFLQKEDSDFVLLQEVDEKADRTYGVNEKEFISDELSSYGNVWAQNWNSPYLFYPVTKPHGKTVSGIITYSKYQIESSIRRSLPVETGVMKIVDLDRAYSVSRLPLDNGKEFILYNLHLSAYTSDGKIADDQVKMLVEDMQKEYEKGNYVVCGGDFNKDLLGDSSAIFGIDGSKYTWAQPFKEDVLNGTDLKLYPPVDNDEIVATSRVADAPYSNEQFVVTIDGFIVSNNIKVKHTKVLDNRFQYSDHNPIEMIFELEK